MLFSNKLLQVNKALDNMEYLLIIKDTFVYFSLEPMLLVPLEMSRRSDFYEYP